MAFHEELESESPHLTRTEKNIDEKKMFGESAFSLTATYSWAYGGFLSLSDLGQRTATRP